MMTVFGNETKYIKIRSREVALLSLDKRGLKEPLTRVALSFTFSRSPQKIAKIGGRRG